MTRFAAPSHIRDAVSLSGAWDFALDADDRATSEAWRSLGVETIQVPGSWEEQGFGTEPVTHALGTWTKLREYEGAAWYSRSIDIPETWQASIIELHLKGVRWQSRLWVDGQAVGERDSLSTAHTYDLTPFVTAGQRHRLTIRIDNRLIYPLQESHPNSEHTATRWGGITGGVELTARPAAGIGRVKCVPNVRARRFEVEVVLGDAAGADASVEISVRNPQTGETFSNRIGVDNNSINAAVNLDESARLWSDNDPFLYDLSIQLYRGDQIIDVWERRVGFREISVQGRQILLNGLPVFMRGYVDCCIFPLTGYPSWDVNDYRRQFEIVRSYGFNHVRLHSWTPPEPFWQAADEMGMLVQTELPHWTRLYGYSEIEPPPEVHQFFMRELDAIVGALHFHPSWVMFSNGNELINTADGHPRLIELSERGKTLDPTRLYTDNTGFGQLPAPSRPVDYYIQSCNWHPPKKIYDAASGDTTQDFSAVTVFADRPLIAHEHGQFTMYVRPSEAEKYTGVIRPAWLESIQETFEAKGITPRVDGYIRASGIHSLRTYKENIERARRTRGLSGIQLLDIRDFPGQGHATTGMLDVFWDSKGLVEPETFARFNSAAVLLMRATSPTFWNGDSIVVDVEISNFSRNAISDQPLQWRLQSRTTQTEFHGEMLVTPAPAGGLTLLGRLEIPTPADANAQPWELSLQLGVVENSWHIWTFPYPHVPDAVGVSSRIPTLRNALPGADFSDNFSGVAPLYHAGRRVYPAWKLAISDQLTGRLLQYLCDGGSVWLMPNAKQLYDYVPTRYLPPFWSYLWFPENTSTVMGMVISEHPALARFPQDGCSDWHWYHLVNDTPAICLDSVPALLPVVEVIDNFNRAKRLSYAFEARVGLGRLFVSTWRLNDPAVSGRPEARFLFNEILHYLRSDAFTPETQMSVGQLLGMFKLTNNLSANLE